MNEIVIFRPSQKESEFQVILDPGKETIWASEQEIADLFDRDRTVIGKHIRNSFKEGELEKDSVSAKFAHTAQDEKIYQVTRYNLDVVISVGYRVKAPIATEFRRWATSKLRDYLLKGYAINENLLKEQNNQIKNLEQEINRIQEESDRTQRNLTEGFLSIITNYAKSFKLLNQYDSEELSTEGLNQDIIYRIDPTEVRKAIQELKLELIRKGEATELFGNEKDKSFEGILGSISQTAFGELAYPTVEQQATQLLYSTIKGHAFSDGNKRIGSFLFVWFLEQNNFHLDSQGQQKINENTLVSIALAVAQSAPDQRELIKQLVINLIKE